MSLDLRPRCCVCGFPAGHKYSGRDYCSDHLVDAESAVLWMDAQSSEEAVFALLGAYQWKGDMQCQLSH